MFATDDGAADPYGADAVAAIDALVGNDPTGLHPARLLARLRTVSRLVDRLEAERVRLLGVAERSGAFNHDGPASWLQRNSTLTASQAGVRARLARRLPPLPVIATAFAQGDLGVDHVSLILGLCRDVGVDNVTAMQDEIVAVTTRLRTVEDFTEQCRQWRHTLRPAATEVTDDPAHEHRWTGALGPIRPRR